jgi:Fe2+ transport system protein FeoA
VKRKPGHPAESAARAPEFICPLSKVRVGSACRIKQLCASPEVAARLREMGFCEEQRIKLLSQHRNLICQVCNARLGISAELAESIWVEPLRAEEKAA